MNKLYTHKYNPQLGFPCEVSNQLSREKHLLADIEVSPKESERESLEIVSDLLYDTYSIATKRTRSGHKINRDQWTMVMYALDLGGLVRAGQKVKIWAGTLDLWNQLDNNVISLADIKFAIKEKGIHYDNRHIGEWAIQGSAWNKLDPKCVRLNMIEQLMLDMKELPVNCTTHYRNDSYVEMEDLLVYHIDGYTNFSCLWDTWALNYFKYSYAPSIDLVNNSISNVSSSNVKLVTRECNSLPTVRKVSYGWDGRVYQYDVEGGDAISVYPSLEALLDYDNDLDLDAIDEAMEIGDGRIVGKFRWLRENVILNERVMGTEVILVVKYPLTTKGNVFALYTDMDTRKVLGISLREVRKICNNEDSAGKYKNYRITIKKVTTLTKERT